MKDHTKAHLVCTEIMFFSDPTWFTINCFAKKCLQLQLGIAVYSGWWAIWLNVFQLWNLVHLQNFVVVKQFIPDEAK